MKSGLYYRCACVTETADVENPRVFILGQLQYYNEISETAQMKFHDFYNCRTYYPKLFEVTTYPKDRLVRCAGAPGSRVYCDYGEGVIVSYKGHVDKDDPLLYYVKLSDGTYISEYETNLKIDFSKMDYDPTEQIKSFEFQNPTFYLARRQVAETHHIVNNAAYGFDTLIGCRTYLMSHQVCTVERCLDKMPVRYMLADEVGLGKTIEACSIVKIMAAQNKGLKALFAVPEALTAQWESELKYKFGINAGYRAKYKYCIVPIERINEANDIVCRDWDVLVVDETHRLLKNKRQYDAILNMSKRTKNVLLLSATPIQDRKEEYLQLVRLIYPERYENMELSEFSILVNKQRKIQKSIYMQIKRMENYERYSEDIKDDLSELAEKLKDGYLNKLIEKIDLESSDKGEETTSQVIAYICENYRVERNVIRNRREAVPEINNKRTLTELPYVPCSSDDMYSESETIESVLNYLSNAGLEDSTAIHIMNAAFSSPWALKSVVEKYGIQDEGITHNLSLWLNQAQNECRCCNTILDTSPENIKGRLLRCLDYIDQELDIINTPETKIVVFTSFNETLLQFEKICNSRFSESGIITVAFGTHMSKDELEDSVFKFQNNPQCKIMICDERGGEGRNFQQAMMVIHLDIPWDPNVLEQRIGRLDRLGRTDGMDVRSLVLYTKGTVENQLFRIWNEGMKVFTQSLSGLEIIMGELREKIISAIKEDYFYGLENAFSEIQEEEQRMHDEVDRERHYDVGASLYGTLSKGVDRTLKLYNSEDNELFSDSMIRWGKQAGLEPESETKIGIREFRSSGFHPGAAIQTQFVPPEWSKYTNSSILRHTGDKLLGTFNRTLAALREDLLFYAPGDPVYDSIDSNAMGCSRGRCTAILTKSDFSFDGFVFTYNVDINYDILFNEGMDFDTNIISRFKMYLPLKQIKVVLRSNLKDLEFDERKVLVLLDDKDRSIYKDTDAHIGRRGKKNGSSLIDRFIAQRGENWEHIVSVISEKARRIAWNRLHEEMDIKAVKREMWRIIHGYESECNFLGRDVSFIESIQKRYETVLNALNSANLQLDSVCFLRVKKNESVERNS